VRSTESDLSPEELERRRVREEARDREGSNRADVTNEQLDRQRERAQRSKLQRVVFIRNGEKVRMQRVETGIADNTFIEIRTGVKAGDEIVSGSYTVISRRLKDGAKVELEKEDS
jgi:HlyD family secretion protein